VKLKNPQVKQRLREVLGRDDRELQNQHVQDNGSEVSNSGKNGTQGRKNCEIQIRNDKNGDRLGQKVLSKKDGEKYHRKVVSGKPSASKKGSPISLAALKGRRLNTNEKKRKSVGAHVAGKT